MNVISILAFIVIMPFITFLFVNKKEKQAQNGRPLDKQLNSLLSYKNFLLNVYQVKIELLAKLTAVNYNSLLYQTYFSTFEMSILKKDINNDIEELEKMIVQDQISIEDFSAAAERLRKRISILSIPLADLQYAAANAYLEVEQVA